MRSLGWICGGATAVVQALFDVLGPEGTLVVPTFTSDNRDPSRWREPPVPEGWWPTIRDTLPAFDPAISAGHRMGAVSEQVRTWPGALRSAQPQTSFAAVGPAAAQVTADHPPDCHLGERSPLARLEELDADVLLLGVGWDRCTAFHLAEYRQPDPPRRAYPCVVATQTSPGRAWISYEDTDLDGRDFTLLGQAFEASQRTRGQGAVLVSAEIGSGRCHRFPLAQAVRFAGDWLPRHRLRRTAGATTSSRLADTTATSRVVVG